MTDTLTSFTRDDLTFDLIDQGPRDGEIVVLLHGWPQLNTCWNEVMAHLNEAGYRTIAPNQRGFAKGARPPGRYAYRMSQLVADIAALLDEIGQPVHLVGHDWGSAIAFMTAIEHPDKVRTLTGVSVPHPSAFIKAMPRGQIKDSWYMAAFNVPFLPQRILSDPRRAELALKVKAKMPARAFESYLRDFAEQPERMRTCFGYYRAIPFASPRSLRPVMVPTSFIWSDHDVAISRVAAELCGDYVSADYRFEVIESASHWLPDEEPEEVARLIEKRIRG
ncbi:MAG: alpha/beta fold hydrolase [Marmoricola sp.]